MKAYWTFARELLAAPWTLAGAVSCAVVSGLGIAAGLGAALPVLDLMLGEDAKGLAGIARDHNAAGGWLQVPDWLLARLPESTDASLGVVLLSLAALTLIGAAANFLHQYLTLTMVTRIVADARQRAFDAAIRLPLSMVVAQGPSDFTSRILRDCSELHGGLVALTNRSLAHVTKGLSAVGVAIWFDWRIVLAAIVAGPPLAYTLRRLGKRINRGMRGTLEAQQRLLLVTNEAMQGLRSVKAATAEPDMGRRFAGANEGVVRNELKLRKVRSLASPLMELLAVFVVLGLVFLAGRELLAGRMQLDRFLMSLGSLAVAAGSFRPLTAFVSDIQSAEAPARRIREILDAATEPGADGGRDVARLSRSIDFVGVGFTYPKAERASLRGIDLTIPAGAHVAIVGPNGCGKSTLLSLIPRLLVPTTGRVVVDGLDLDGASLRSWRSQVGVVSQEAVLVHGTIAENIALGCASATLESIVAAAQRAHADAFIRALPHGYDTLVAEQGMSLSGGQRQRIVIARAALRDPAVLLMDEATSQVDADSERQINEAIREFGKGRTVITVAHRLSTVLAADWIVVMDQGQIVDRGTHAELIERCGVYRAIASSQLATASA
ncbi:MAG: ABC transporter ATP-binding protein [Phycisphaerae bacterium]|nr:ABC transporter ATP-binding protein [Phycisphaerae bacterium]